MPEKDIYLRCAAHLSFALHDYRAAVQDDCKRRFRMYLATGSMDELNMGNLTALYTRVGTLCAALGTGIPRHEAIMEGWSYPVLYEDEVLFLQ